jgi:hypothetical protein
MKRLAVAVLLALPMLVLAAPSALAAEPTRQRESIEGTFVDTSCGFPVQVEGNGFVDTIQWIDANGNTRTIATFPQAKVTFTNLDTGTTIQVNVAGPAQLDERTDGSFTVVAIGTFWGQNNPDTGEPGLFWSAGRMTFSVDAAGNESFQRVGTLTNLCPQLAA